MSFAIVSTLRWQTSWKRPCGFLKHHLFWKTPTVVGWIDANTRVVWWRFGRLWYTADRSTLTGQQTSYVLSCYCTYTWFLPKSEFPAKKCVPEKGKTQPQWTHSQMEICLVVRLYLIMGAPVSNFFPFTFSYAKIRHVNGQEAELLTNIIMLQGKGYRCPHLTQFFCAKQTVCHAMGRVK